MTKGKTLIFTDGTHIVSDSSLEELHAFATQAGIARHWFEGVKKGHPHYDKPKRHCLHCLLKFDNIKFVSPKEVVRAVRRMKTS